MRPNVSTRSWRSFTAAGNVFGLFAALVSASASAQPHAHGGGHGHAEREIHFPDVEGYLTLTTDLHTHSVFSDGSVWPTIRVEEAVRDGLDAISLTEHLEYQPHKDDIPHPDRNRAYELALQSAAGSDLLIIPGSEVTRSNPPGHVNAIFIQDANRLLLEDPLEVLKEANRQGAYLFWNHPNWLGQRADGTATLTEFHRSLIDQDLLHGIEVVNDHTYSDEALQIGLDNKLAIIGTSDVHGLVDWSYNVGHGGHRPVTLVFAEVRSLQGIHNALKARRTVAWYDDLLVGEASNMALLLPAILSLEGPGEYARSGDQASTVLSVSIRNHSSANLILEHTGPYRFHNLPRVFSLEANAAKTLEVKTGTHLEAIDLRFAVLSALVEPETHPALTLSTTTTHRQ